VQALKTITVSTGETLVGKYNASGIRTGHYINCSIIFFNICNGHIKITEFIKKNY